MELHEVEAIDLKVLEASFDERREVFAIVPFGDMGAQSTAGLGGDHRP